MVDFSFIYDELLANYCLDNGRSAVPPIRMFKYLLLKSIYDLSDIDVVERSKYDMSFKYFLDIRQQSQRMHRAGHIAVMHHIHGGRLRFLRAGGLPSVQKRTDAGA